MKTTVGVIAALVTFGLVALGLFAAHQLASPPSHVAAGPTFTDPAQGTIVPAAQPTGSATAPVSAAAPESAPAEPPSSGPPPTASEQNPQSNAHSGQTATATMESPEARPATYEVPGARSNTGQCENTDGIGVSRLVE